MSAATNIGLAPAPGLGEAIFRSWHDMDPATRMIFGIAAVFYVFLSVRIALHARKRGRSALAWLFITLFFTAVPALVMFIADWLRWRRQRRSGAARTGPPRLLTCRHCSGTFGPAELDRSSGAPVCPRCGMIFNEDILA
jgi:hypothetical protein